ncbi:MAG TPA: hypothetical protein VKT22_05620 [Steroidobacteraceae bacterium]|nr:hypothetical protein [Steroidobacteraceae bacterium]
MLALATLLGVLACGGGGGGAPGASSSGSGGGTGGGTGGGGGSGSGGSGGGSGSATAPHIGTPPQNAATTAGLTATFTVSASGTAPLSYRWAKNGTVITGASGASYITPATVLSDSGAQFTVTVSNSAGSVTSAAVLLTVTAPSADVTTFHNDVSRTGAYLAETQLNPANVKASGFGLKRLLAVDGKIDAQPLVLTQFAIGGSTRTVVFAATEHGSVYAFDAQSGSLLWHVSLIGAGETSSDDRGCGQVTPEIGITSTPVIDRGAGRMLVVAMSKDGGSTYHQRLHALSLTTGAELAGSPVDISASITATGAPGTTNGQLVFAPGQYKERSALLLAQGTLYTSWASHCDEENYTGWILAYDETTLAPTAVFNTEPSGAYGNGQGEASFWNANSGPSADADGTIYAMSANGIFDAQLTATGFPAGNDYGNSILKLTPATNGKMAVLDYFTMYNSTPESAGDVDLGSGGLLLLPDLLDAGGRARHLAVGAGKDHTIYVVDREDLGKFNSSSDSNAYQALMSALPGGVYGSPVYFGQMLYYDAASDVVRGLKLKNALLASSATATTSTVFPYPGAAISLSANGAGNAIVWAVQNDSSQGVLHAYDAATLTELYSSASSGTRDQFGPGSKFTPPTIAGGLVFVATQAAGSSNHIAVFGLL